MKNRHWLIKSNQTKISKWIRKQNLIASYCNSNEINNEPNRFEIHLRSTPTYISRRKNASNVYLVGWLVYYRQCKQFFFSFQTKSVKLLLEIVVREQVRACVIFKSINKNWFLYLFSFFHFGFVINTISSNPNAMDFVNGATLFLPTKKYAIQLWSHWKREGQRDFRKHSNPTHTYEVELYRRKRNGKGKSKRKQVFFSICLFPWCCCMRSLFFSYCFGIVPLSVFYRFTTTRTHIERSNCVQMSLRFVCNSFWAAHYYQSIFV